MSDDLDAMKRRAEQTRPGPDGVRPLRPGLPRAAYEDREALIAEVERLRTAMWECPDCAFGFDATHTDQGGGYSCPVCGEAKAEAERDALRATVERVEALVGQVTAAGPPDGGTSVCNLLADLRAALHPQEPHTPAQDAGSGSDGSEGAGSVGGRERGAVRVNGVPFQPIRQPACGDRLTTWHGPIGPCVLTGRHELHDDGAGVTWSRTVVPTPGGQP